MGFKRGVSNPCIFYHEVREVRAVVHGDDLTLLGPVNELEWVKTNIMKAMTVKEKAMLTRETLGKVRILNRIVEAKADCLEYEADQRHSAHPVRMQRVKEESVKRPRTEVCVGHLQQGRII